MKNYTCKFCDSPATHGARWAEGRAIVPCCAEHKDKAMKAGDVPKDPTAKMTKLSQFEIGFWGEREKIALDLDPALARRLAAGQPAMQPIPDYLTQMQPIPMAAVGGAEPGITPAQIKQIGGTAMGVVESYLKGPAQPRRYASYNPPQVTSGFRY